jgi:hypothetical protein
MVEHSGVKCTAEHHKPLFWRRLATELSPLLVPQLCPMFWSEPPKMAQIIWAHLPFPSTVTTENLGLAHHRSCSSHVAMLYGSCGCRNDNSPVTGSKLSRRRPESKPAPFAEPEPKGCATRSRVKAVPAAAVPVTAFRNNRPPPPLS